MNRRVFSVILLVTILPLGVGCSGMKNFIFGKGARCGICNRGAVATSHDPCGCPPGTHAYRGIGESVCGYDHVDPYTQPGTTGADGFNARKFDSDGSQIIWEETKPDGKDL
ncbi:MAG: hypothetical protein ISQ09_12530 [Rubripirellula sp.]|nr:hypothetical protein [Rubripirellula sp.]